MVTNVQMTKIINFNQNKAFSYASLLLGRLKRYFLVYFMIPFHLNILLLLLMNTASFRNGLLSPSDSGEHWI